MVGSDENLGPVVMSLKNEHMASQDHTRILLRLRTETMHGLIPTTSEFTTLYDIILHLRMMGRLKLTGFDYPEAYKRLGKGIC